MIMSDKAINDDVLDEVSGGMQLTAGSLTYKRPGGKKAAASTADFVRGKDEVPTTKNMSGGRVRGTNSMTGRSISNVAVKC